MNDKRRKRYIVGFLLLTAAVVILLLLNLGTGSVRVSPEEILSILVKGETDGTKAGIILDIRIPRLLAALILGGALAVSGFLLQTFFANPIAGPFVLGISSGSKLVLALVMIASVNTGRMLGSAQMIGAAFVGALGSMLVILMISQRVQKMSVLVICGVMIGYICSAVTDFAVSFADDSNIVNLHHWSMGSFSGMSWNDIRTMAAAAGIALVLTCLLSKPMAAYQMGDVYAASVGLNLKRFRVELILISSILSALVTAFAGPVSFVGIAVPHLMRSLFKTAKPAILIPGCFLGGGVFCLLADLLARTLFAPTELNLSSVTALLGAPVVIAAMLKRSKNRY